MQRLRSVGATSPTAFFQPGAAYPAPPQHSYSPRISEGLGRSIGNMLIKGLR